MEVTKDLQCDDISGMDKLIEFNRKHIQAFELPGLTREDKFFLVHHALGGLQTENPSATYISCLQTIRILSREKGDLDLITTEDALLTLLKHAGLEPGVDLDTLSVAAAQCSSYTTVVEAQKCLCNIIFNSPVAQKACSTNGCVNGIIQRLKTYKDPELPHEVKFYDMRMLFLVTALVRDIRLQLFQDLHGFTYLIEVLDLILREEEDKHRPLEDFDVDLSAEILKILFNITEALDRNNLDEEDEAHFLRLVSILHDLLLCETVSKEKKEILQSHTVNLLTNMPRESYEELLTPMTEEAAGGMENKDIEYDGKNMQAILTLLEFLDKRLSVPVQSMKESLTPILLCFGEMCRGNRAIRKFCRVKILPFMRDEVRSLPEEGDTVRNRLCRLLTHPLTEVKDLAADFLFVLCKESVPRFVKYTGYGNAAGLLAQRGLMCGGRGAVYSSESEDSETEEYCGLKDRINPITGRWEEARTNPMDCMTEEQKEMEAAKLMNDLDQLTRMGVIQPTCVGEDGKPHPVDSVLELAEKMAAMPGSRNPDPDSS